MQKLLRSFYILIGLMLAFNAKAQRVDVGLLLGTSYYYGDVVNEITPAAIGPAVGGFMRLRVTDRLALKGFGGYIKISGDDQYSSSEWQKQRNWTFETTILEGSLQAELNLLEDRNRGRRFANPFIPYLFGGIGFISFNPQGDYMGTMLDLAPLQLSGIPYETTAITVPFGIGFRYYIVRNFQIGAEFGVRYTNTSYLDDIAPNDTYIDAATSINPTLTTYYYSKSTANRNPGDLRSKMGDVKEASGSGGFDQMLGKTDLYFVNAITLAYTFGRSISGASGGGRGRSTGKAIRCPRFY